MEQKITHQFSKHYKRMIEDLRQIVGFTPVMEKVISANMSKLEMDVKIKYEENDDGTNFNR